MAENTIKKTNKPPFSWRDEVGYIFGDMAGSFVNLFIDAFYLTFCTYVLGVSPIFMGTLFLVARLFDAINDPIIGSFPDRWRLGKKGDKFKPYIKIAMWPLALANILCFTDVSSFSDTALHVWVSFAYVLYGVSYTGTSMPFGAMANVITDKPEERTKLSRARSIGGTVVGFGALSIVPLFAWDANNAPIPKAFFIIAVIFAILSLLGYTALMNMTHERIAEAPKEESFNYSLVIKDAFRNRPLIGVMVATVGSLIYITGNSQLGQIMFKEYYNRPDILAYVNFASLFVLLVALPTVPRLANSLGKQKTILFAVTGNFILSLFLMLVPIANPYLFAALFIIANIGQTCFTMLIWALVSDCLDYHQFKFGYRSDGSLYSIYTFSRKIGSTLASTLASYALAGIGFVSGVASQSVEVSQHIRLLYTAVPVVTTILEIIGIGLIFNLNKEKTDAIYQELQAEHRNK